MSLPHTLTGLTPREAILDALYRGAQAWDTNDRSLHDSAFIPSPSSSFTLVGLETYPGIEGIRSIFHRITKLDTTHNISCPRVQIHENGKTAQMTATVLAQHFRAGEGFLPETKFFMSGAVYDVDAEVDESDGVWKMKNIRVNVKWTEGDPAVVGR